MSAPNPPENAAVPDDSMGYMSAVVYRLNSLVRMIGLIDFEKDPPHLMFHHYAVRHSVLQCAKSVAQCFLQEIEEHLPGVPLLDEQGREVKE